RFGRAWPHRSASTTREFHSVQSSAPLRFVLARVLPDAPPPAEVQLPGLPAAQRARFAAAPAFAVPGWVAAVHPALWPGGRKVRQSSMQARQSIVRSLGSLTRVSRA